jgi:hypothetical protein
MPYSSNTGWSIQEQGVQGILTILESRLQALEQAVFGGAYASQQTNLGQIGDINDILIPGPGQGSQAGQASAGNR